MAILTITPADVDIGSSDVVTVIFAAGETIGRGQVVYQDLDNDGVIMLARCDTTDAAALVLGISLSSGVLGDDLMIATTGIIIPGATLVQGTPYFLAATPGGIVVHSELVSTNRVSELFIAEDTEKAELILKSYSIAI